MMMSRRPSQATSPRFGLLNRFASSASIYHLHPISILHLPSISIFISIFISINRHNRQNARQQNHQNHPLLVRPVPSLPNPTNNQTRLEKSRSQRILWLLEELDLAYELETFSRQPDLLAPPELKNIHPLGKSPVIKLEPEGKKPIVLAESAVIIEYLCEHFGAATGLIPEKFSDGDHTPDAADAESEIGTESEEYMRYRYFMHYAEGSLMPFLVMQLVMDRSFPPPVPCPLGVDSG